MTRKTMTPSTRISILTPLLLTLLLSGCGIGNYFGTRLSSVQTVTEPPNRVTVFVTVKDGKEPIGGLAEHNFSLYEDGVRLNNGEIGLNLLPRDTVAAGFTVLLVDLSGRPSDADLNRIERGAAHFVEKVTVTQPVTIVAFDGSARPRQVASYAQVKESVKRDIPKLSQFMSGDSSRDLNGALLSALSGVKAELEKQKKRGGFGTVVTMTRGPDLARRKSDQEAKAAIRASDYEFYLIAPEDRAMPNASSLGRDARFEYASLDTLPMKMADLGIRVRDSWNSHYLLSYCSPARAGERKLRVKVRFESDRGQNHSASDKSNFDASGFEGGCEEPNSVAPVKTSSPSSASANQPPQADQPTQAAAARSSTSTAKRPQKAANSAEPDEETGEVVEPPPTGKYE